MGAWSTGVVVLVASAAASAQTAFELRGRLDSEYTSNLFHEQRRRLDDFAEAGEAGERYGAMPSPWDVVTHVSARPELAWELGRRRDLSAWLQGSYFFHAQNRVANFLTLGLGASYDFSKRDRLRGSFAWTPQRFRKNYLARRTVEGDLFEPAFFQDASSELEYRHLWSKRWRTDLVYALEARRFFAPFENRHRDLHAAELWVRYRPLGELELALGARGAVGFTPAGLEFGISIDRSHRDVAGLFQLALELPATFELTLEAEYRARRYTTDNALNDTYFGRRDARYVLALDLSKKLGRGLALAVGLGWIENNTNRNDQPGIDPGELAYDEATVNLRLNASM